MFESKPEFKSIPEVKVMFNIGCLMDIPTGYYADGIHGEQILNGGLGVLTGITGRGNTFKSTLMHYMMLSAVEKIFQGGVKTYINTYDTEMNIHIDRLSTFTHQFEGFNGMDIIEDGVWNITDKTMHSGNEWFEILKKFIKQDKLKNIKRYTLETPFIDKKKNRISVLAPTFGEIDSFSEFDTDDTSKIQDENELGSSGGNTIHMRSGLAKTRLLMELPVLCNQGAHYTLLSAHLGTDIQMAQGPYAAPNPKKLQTLKVGEKVKGVTDKFYFLTNNFWKTVDSKPFINQATKSDEYPEDNSKESEVNDLYIVPLAQLRSKSGPTSITIDVLISQSQGVLPELTEFHYIKTLDRYGLSGTLQSYALDLYPECKLSRTTIRKKIKEDPKLRRALNITAELCQMEHVWSYMGEDIPKPKDIYEKLKSLGYDWDVLLNTRGWWTFNNDKHPIPFLSTKDIINMYNGVYKPYWS